MTNEHLQEQMNELKDKLCESTGHTATSTTRFFFFSVVAFVLIFVLLFSSSFLNLTLIFVDVAKEEDRYEEVGR